MAQFDSGFMRAEQMIDLERYPIEDLTSGEGAEFARLSRRQFEETGLCMLPGFVRSQALDTLADEANGVAGQAYFCRSTHNPYLQLDDASLPDGHAKRRQEHTYVGSVAYDLVPEDGVLRRLYDWDPLKNFIAAVMGKTELHRFADPFGACSINVFCDGGQHGWHFDESEFTVTLMLQPPEEGGAFEYVPRIRGLPDEYQIVDKVLDGARDGVNQLPFTPGTLLIFGGQQTLHRVTEVKGERLRLVPVLCFSETPGVTNSEEVRKLFWGRSGPEVRP